MANEIMCIFFPLKIITYPKGEYGLEDNPVEIMPAEAVAYEVMLFSPRRFFMWCIRIPSLKQKMCSTGDCAGRGRCCHGK